MDLAVQRDSSAVIMIKFDEKELLTMRKSFFAKLSVLSVLFAFVLGAAPAAARCMNTMIM